MNQRSLLLAGMLAFLSGCAVLHPRTYPAGETLLGRTPSSSEWSASSARAHYQIHWVTPHAQSVFLADVRTLGTMGRIDFALPNGMSAASVTWRGTHWQEYLPYQSTFLEGDGESVPVPTLGIPAFPLLELERLARGLLLPPGAMRSSMSTLYSGKGIRVLLSEPDVAMRRWAIHLGEKDGFVLRVQRFQGPVQEEDLQIASYLPKVPVPSHLRREFDTATYLDVELQNWSDRTFVSPTEFILPYEPQADTITVGQDHAGRRYYTIRSSRPTVIAPFPSDFLADLMPAPADSEAVDSSDSTDDEDSSDAGDDGDDSDEEDAAAPEPAAPAPVVPSTPSLPAVLKPETKEKAVARPPDGTPADSSSDAPPPSEDAVRKF